MKKGEENGEKMESKHVALLLAAGGSHEMENGSLV